MLKVVLSLFFLLYYQSSNYENNKIFFSALPKKYTDKADIIKTKCKYTAFELELLQNGFVDLETFIPNIKIDLKYATVDNFTGKVLYTNIRHAFLHKSAALKLKKAQELLKEYDNSFSFIVYDAFRPQSVQHKMWDAVKNTPKARYVANPNKGSMHNFGCAVDLSIININNVLLDMGSAFDYFGEISQYRYNNRFIAEKKLTKLQVSNRVLLRDIMLKAGFYPINSEWWHFNAYKNTFVRKNFKIIH